MPSGPDYQIVMQRWHAFFARGKFPLTLADRDGASLCFHDSTFNRQTYPPCLVPGNQVLFTFVAVDANDYLKGYKICSGDLYVGGLTTYFGPMNTDCLGTTADLSQALTFLPVFTSPMTFYIQNMADGTLMTRPWDWFSGSYLGPREAILLGSLGQQGFGAIQQVFKMPGWPLRVMHMAYLPTDVQFFLSSGDKNLYADGSQLSLGTATDASALCAVATPDPGSLHAGYVLCVGGKYVQMTTVDNAVLLVDGVADATPLCAIYKDDGSLSFWHCESDHLLGLKGSQPVFTLCDDPAAVPPSWRPVGYEPPRFDSLAADTTSKNLAGTVYLRPIVAGLKASDPLKRQTSWDYSFDNVFTPDWLMATPDNAFGNYADFEMPIVQQGANDFNLQACTSSTDPKHPCVPLSSTVTTPGGAPVSLQAGHSRVIYEEMYKIIASGTEFIDILSLLRNTATPSGEFLAAIRNAITYLSNKPEAAGITIRMLFGEPLGWAGDTGWIPGTGPYLSAPDLLRQLTRDIPASTGSRMKIYLAYTSSVPEITWNHAKAIAVDAQRAIVGGHNMWAEPYLHDNPVLDVSLKLSGLAAVDAHRFADNLWFEQVLSHGDYWVADSASFVAPATFATGQSAVPQVRLFSQYYVPPANNPGRESGTGIPVLSVGREEGTAAPAAPSDKALIALLGTATQTIYISAQAMSHDPIYPRHWPEEFLGALAEALKRGVLITLFMSDPSGGSYAGDPPGDVMSQIQNRITGKSAPEINALIANLAVRSFPSASFWGLVGQPGISNHAKILLVDKTAFSIGSQNFYPSTPATLSEFTYIVEDAGLGEVLYDTYFKKMEAWALPKPGVQPLVDRSQYSIRLHSLICITASDSGWAQLDPDQCYLSLSGSRIFPGGSYVELNAGDSATVELTLPLIMAIDNALTVSLWEWDWISDDLLGQFAFHPNTPLQYWTSAGAQTSTLAGLTPGVQYAMMGNMSDDKAVYHLVFSYLRISPA